ncbi:MAG TPA: hypothetical protein DD727_04955, partial [Clostridiales bacterium]|nr:hypothetical protein [Clostridiales bacterium]
TQSTGKSNFPFRLFRLPVFYFMYSTLFLILVFIFVCTAKGTFCGRIFFNRVFKMMTDSTGLSAYLHTTVTFVCFNGAIRGIMVL